MGHFQAIGTWVVVVRTMEKEGQGKKLGANDATLSRPHIDLAGAELPMVRCQGELGSMSGKQSCEWAVQGWLK